MTKKLDSGELLFVRQDIGNGRPIVLLHGMFGDGTQWRVIADLLSDYYRVIVVDLLGHGKSPRPKNAKYTPTEHSRSLRRTLEKLKATEDLTIVGYSMGGTVALKYAADYRDVSQLYMISTPFYLRPEEMVETGYANSLLYTKISLTLYRWVDKSLKKDKLLYKIVEKENLIKWLHVLIDAYDNKLDPEVTRLNLKNLINEFEFAKTLRKVVSPTTFYSGKRDVFVVHGQLLALRKIKPLMEIETLGIVKNDHMLVQYLPQQMVEVLTRYQQQLLHVGTDLGNGSVLVMLHGIESSSGYWDNMLPILSKKHRVITIDLLGFGRSPKPRNIAYSLEDQVKWLKRTLDSMGVKKFSLIGHSLGALVAMAFAAAYPKQVKQLFLASPVLINPAQSYKRLLVKKFNYIEYFSDTGYLVSTISKTVGRKKIAKFIPTIRSATNAVKNQNSFNLARQIKNVNTTIIYGEKDRLIDEQQLHSIVKLMRKPRVVTISGGTHNFPLYQPKALLRVIQPNIEDTSVKKGKIKPNRVLKQLVKLASPILLVKGLLYVSAGLLLFSQYKEETLVAGVAILVMAQSFQFIRGSFSLKNEGLSYIGYFSLGMFGIVLGFVLTNHFKFSLLLALIIVCGYILVSGISRILAGVLWTTNKDLRRRQLLSGLIAFLVALAAFLGSLVSVHAIVFAVAGYLLARGLTFGFYLFVSLLAAFSRSYH